MGIDFPDAPAAEQVFPVPDGPTYVFRDGVWRLMGGTPIPNYRATAEARNRFVNGALQISQENGNNAVTIQGGYPADQFTAVHSSGLVGTLQRVAVVTPNGSQYRIRWVNTTADSSMAQYDTVRFFSRLEGVRVADFLWGTAQAKQAVLRFGFKGPAGVYTAGLMNAASTRAFLADFTISAAQANTDTEQVIVVPGDTTGTWLTDTGVGIAFHICLGSGEWSRGVNGWQSGDVHSTGAATGNANLGSTANVFEFFDLGLYRDPNNTGLPPPWQMPDYAEALEACKRYWQWLGFNSYFYAAAAVAAQVTQNTLGIAMRVTPAASAIAADPETTQSNVNNGTNSVTPRNPYTMELVLSGTAIGNTYVRGYRVALNARM